MRKNDDLISRQAAIDAFDCSISGVPFDSAIYVSEYVEKMIGRINALPPTQPEIVRCRDCKYRIENKHYGERGYLKLKAECEWDTGDPYGLGRNAEDDEWFCADGERREDDVDPSDR